jgi:hypothetical protein
MQETSSVRERLRPDTADTNIEWSALWRMLFPAVRDLRNRGYVLLRDHRKLKWALAVLVAFIFFQSYFVRELVAALFFFTILYAVLATLVTSYVLFDHVLYSGTLWVGSLGHSFCLFLHNHIASPSWVLSLSNSRASDGDQKLGRASPGASLPLELVLQPGRSSCSKLHYLGGRKAKGDGQ